MKPAGRLPPVGAKWRLRTSGKDGRDAWSDDYAGRRPGSACFKRQILDELVIDDWFSIEQMDARTWCLRIGEDQVMVTIGRDRKPTLGEWYK